MTASVSVNTRNAVVLMTRIPQPGHTKTRMMPELSPDQCAELHVAMLHDAAALCRNLSEHCDIYVACASVGEKDTLRNYFDIPAHFFDQCDGGLGDRMRLAVSEVQQQACQRCVLIGVDTPEMQAADIYEAFILLDDVDVVFGPACDGGFYLVGVKEPLQAAFCLSAYGHSHVLSQTLNELDRDGCSYALLRSLHDLDCWDDASALLARAHDNALLDRLHTVRYLRQVTS